MADDPEHVGSRDLLFLRIVQLAGEPHRGTAAAHSGRIAALRHFRLAASRVSQFAACSGAPSHGLSQGSGLRRLSKGITAGICDRRNGLQYKFCKNPERSLAALDSWLFSNAGRALASPDGCCGAWDFRALRAE